MNAPKLEFMVAMAIADNAARLISQERPRKRKERGLAEDETDRKCAMILRQNPVAALRWLWKTGDASQRSTVACRVAVWLGFPQERVKAIGARILAREKARVTP